jgi:hypothetical protein
VSFLLWIKIAIFVPYNLFLRIEQKENNK